MLRVLGVLLLRHGGQDLQLGRSSEAQEGVGEPFNGKYSSIRYHPASLHRDLVVRYLRYGT